MGYSLIVKVGGFTFLKNLGGVVPKVVFKKLCEGWDQTFSKVSLGTPTLSLKSLKVNS